VETTELEKVKSFNKTLELVEVFYAAGIRCYYQRFQTEQAEGTFDDFLCWIDKLKETHPNHHFWMMLLFEVLPAFFVLRSTIRKGQPGGSSKEYKVRQLIWLKLSILFVVTNKSKYLQVFALQREDELTLSKMELAAIQSALFRSGWEGHVLANDEAVEFVNRDIKAALADHDATAEKVKFMRIDDFQYCGEDEKAIQH